MKSSIQLDFEAPIAELEKKMEELKHFSEEQDIDVASEIDKMEEKIETLRKEIYGSLTAWQKVQVARHPDRPYTMDYIQAMTTDFIEVHGDRIHRDDRAIVGGLPNWAINA